jgi:hypothetical protein
MGSLPHFTERNQLYYLLITPFAVSCSGRINKATTLAALPLNRIIGSKLSPTFRTEHGIRIGYRATLGTLVDPKFRPTSFAKSRISIV